MSNLTRTWDAVYDRQRAARLQQEAVDGMRSIRQQLISYLPNLGQQQQGLAAPAAATETLAASGVPDLVSDSALSLPAAAATSTIDVASEHAAATKSDDCFSDDDDSSSDEDDDDLPPSSATARPSVPSQTLQSQPYLNDFNAQASQQQQQQQLASQPRCVPSASSYHHKSGQMHQQQRTTALLVSGTLTSALQPTQGKVRRENVHQC